MESKSIRRSFFFLRAIVPLFCARLFAQGGDVPQLQEREQFDLNLPKLSTSADDETGEFDGVRIIFPKMNDQVFIGTYGDLYIKSSPRGNEKTLYREVPEKAGLITKFEAKYLSKVDRDFVAFLELFDKLLQQGRWSRCRYLDGYFPRFLDGYRYLICAARNSPGAMPRGARIPESAYDVSLNSPKTDARINQWRTSQEYIIKLRIASKELAHQLKVWQKYLDKVKENEDIASSKELEESFVIFVRVYFNLKPPSPIMVKKP